VDIGLLGKRVLVNIKESVCFLLDYLNFLGHYLEKIFGIK